MRTASAFVAAAAFAGAAAGRDPLPLPDKMVGMYCLAADNTVANYTDKDDWQPALSAYQQTGPNVLFLTFIDPTEMAVPKAFGNLGKTRGSSAPGSLPADMPLLFSVGGYSYSEKPNPWPFLTSAAKAKSMAAEVATWQDKYGADGIDLDIESGAGGAANVGENMMVFIKELRRLAPKFAITQPVFGYPQVDAENYVVNHSWNKTGAWLGGADRVGVMVYGGTGSLQYVKNYVNATKQWQGFPIEVDVPSPAVVCGLGGDAGSDTIDTMAKAVRDQNLGGAMVWYASVLDAATGKPAFQYGGGGADASVKSTTADWAKAVATMRGH